MRDMRESNMRERERENAEKQERWPWGKKGGKRVHRAVIEWRVLIG